jgi:hypothetical protein
VRAKSALVISPRASRVRPRRCRRRRGDAVAQLRAPPRGGGEEGAHPLQVLAGPAAHADRRGHGPPQDRPPEDLRLRDPQTGRDLAEDAFERAGPALHPEGVDHREDRREVHVEAATDVAHHVEAGEGRRRHGLVDEQLHERPGDRGHDVGDGLAEVARRPQVLAFEAVVPRLQLWCQPGDRTRLHDREHIVVSGPLHVHRHAVQLLHPHAQRGQRDGLSFVEDRSAAQLVGHGAVLGADGGADRHHRLVARAHARHGAAGHGDHVRRDPTADHRFAEPPRRVDHGRSAVAGDRVGREQDAGCVRGHELLHNDGQRDVVVRDAAPVAVGHGARVPQRRPAALDRVQQAVAPDVEVGVLLAREGQVGQVLGRRRRTNGDRDVVTERPVGPADLLGDRLGHVLPGEQRLRRGRIGRVDPVAETGDEPAVRLGGDVETGRDRQPGGGHPGQRGALAAHTRQVSGRVVDRQHHLHGVLPVAGRHLPTPMGLLPLGLRERFSPSTTSREPARGLKGP